MSAMPAAERRPRTSKASIPPCRPCCWSGAARAAGRRAGRGRARASREGAPRASSGDRVACAECWRRRKGQRLDPAEGEPGLEGRLDASRCSCGRSGDARAASRRAQVRAPPTVLLWPSMCLVVEYTETSAPSSRGRCSTGVRKVLSTASGSAPRAGRPPRTAAMSVRARGWGWRASRRSTSRVRGVMRGGQRPRGPWCRRNWPRRRSPRGSSRSRRTVPAVARPPRRPRDRPRAARARKRAVIRGQAGGEADGQEAHPRSVAEARARATETVGFEARV